MTKWIKVRGLTLSYVDAGDPMSPRVAVFVHGNSSCKEVFKDQMSSALGSEYRLVGLDLPGHGESEWDKKAANDATVYTLPYYAEFVSDFVSALALPTPILIGHSLGGHIAIAVSRLEALVGLMVFQTPPLETLDDVAKGFNNVPGLATLFTDKFNEEELAVLMKTFYPNGVAPPSAKESFRKTDPLCRKNVGLSLCPGCQLGEVSQLKRIECPICILVTDEDSLINRQYVHSLPLKDLSNCKVTEMAGLGHYPQLENPGRFNSFLKRFFDGAFASPITTRITSGRKR